MNRVSILSTLAAALLCGTAHADFSTVINVPPQSAPASIGSDTQLNVTAGGSIPANFNAGVEGGSTANVEVNITGGTVGARFNANVGATVNVYGGNIGLRFRTQQGSTANIHGGTFGRDVSLEIGSVANIYGGQFPFEVHGLAGAVVNVWGGAITHFQSHDQTVSSFYGSKFFVDRVELTNLVPGYAEIIHERDVPFSGILADGSPFNFMLTSAHPDENEGQTGPDVDHFSHHTTLVVTYVPTADFDGDFDVDADDLIDWTTSYGNGPGADSDRDGDTDGADFLEWQRQYSGPISQVAVSEPVPEPAGAALAIGAGIAMLRRGRFGRRLL